MITYINSKNANKYSSLFSEAEKALAAKWKKENINVNDDDHFGPWDEENQCYEHGITSLNTYFSWINDLLSISGTLTPIDKEGNLLPDESYECDGMKFSMLPLDEDVFEINANTRKITVPQDFVNNGISVQSDEISEVVYFKVDRFYDATDLFNQDIMIEWKAPDGVTKGYSVPTIKTLDETTNYVIFGWALSSTLTEKAGNITFAVRFYKYDDDIGKIQYSLSTLTQTAKIMPNIDLKIADLLKNHGILDGYKVLEGDKALIIERSENSNAGAAGDKAQMPATKEEYLDVSPANSSAPWVVVLELSDGSYAAHVSGYGYSDDAGTISYVWKKYDYLTGERVQVPGAAEGKELKYETIYTELSIAEAKKEHESNTSLLYFDKSEKNGVASYAVVVDFDALEAAGVTHVYRKDTTCTFDGVGYYMLAIKNRKGRSTETYNVDPMIVYPPCVPTIVEAENKTAFLDGEEAEKTIKVTYSINSKPDVDPAFANPAMSGDPTKFGYKNEAGELSAKYAFDPKNERVAFEWHYKDLNGGDDTIVENGNEATLAPTSEGDYHCILTGKLNGADSETIATEPWRVSYLPARAIFSVSGTAVADGGEIAVSNDPDLNYDEELASKKDPGAYSMYIGRNEPMVAKYSISSMKQSAEKQDAGHALTDKIVAQLYSYELARDEAGHVAKAADLGDAIKAKMGTYTPQVRNSINWPADVAIGEPVEFTIDELKDMEKEGYVTLQSIVPEKDGYYFWMVTNTYNGKDAVVSTPLTYYDNLND